jgi:hypothetical protein
LPTASWTPGSPEALLELIPDAELDPLPEREPEPLVVPLPEPELDSEPEPPLDDAPPSTVWLDIDDAADSDEDADEPPSGTVLDPVPVDVSELDPVVRMLEAPLAPELVVWWELVLPELPRGMIGVKLEDSPAPVDDDPHAATKAAAATLEQSPRRDVT